MAVDIADSKSQFRGDRFQRPLAKAPRLSSIQIPTLLADTGGALGTFLHSDTLHDVKRALAEL